MATYLTPLLNLETTSTNLVQHGGMTGVWTALDNINGTLTVTIPAGSGCDGTYPTGLFGGRVQLDIMAIGRCVAHVEVTGGGCARVSAPNVTIARVRTAAFVSFGQVVGKFVSGSPNCTAGDLELLSGDNPASVPLRCGDTLRLIVSTSFVTECPEMEVTLTVRIDPPTCE